jgi:hypothetical protein
VWFYLLGLVVFGLVGLLFYNRRHLDKANANLVEGLLSDAGQQSERVFQKQDLQGLPQPVQRYLGKVLSEGLPLVKQVRLVQKGEFRLGDASAPWKPLGATQHFTVDPPGFVWDAKIEMFPFLSARVVDMYRNGKGSLHAKILWTIPVADAGPGDEMNAGELMRYLAEAVWFPTAFLPGQGVEWSPVDDRTARATLTDGGTTVSLAFHFDDNDTVDRVFAENRYRTVDDRLEPTPWTGFFRNYQPRNGLLIPLDGEVQWNLPEGDLSYWRAHVEQIEHQPV